MSEMDSGAAGRGGGGCVAFTPVHVMFDNWEVCSVLFHPADSDSTPRWAAELRRQNWFHKYLYFTVKSHFRVFFE